MCHTPHNHSIGVNSASSASATQKPHSTKRSLHIFDSIQSIFQTNNHHNHSFNERHHHNHDKKHKHNNHTIDSSASAKHNSHRHSDSHNKSKKNSSTDHRDTKKHANTTAASTTTAAVSATTAAVSATTATTNTIAATVADSNAASKMQNVTRILINATNPNQSNGNYSPSYMPVERALQRQFVLIWNLIIATFAFAIVATFVPTNISIFACDFIHMLKKPSSQKKKHIIQLIRPQFDSFKRIELHLLILITLLHSIQYSSLLSQILFLLNALRHSNFLFYFVYLFLYFCLNPLNMTLICYSNCFYYYYCIINKQTKKNKSNK